MLSALLSALCIQGTTVPVWAPPGIADDANSHVAFRTQFKAVGNRTPLKIVGASAYLVWLDGKLIHDGPARFAKAFPEYQTIDVDTSPGRHTLAIQVHNEGATTRIMSQMQPFLWTEIGDRQPLSWKCARLGGYRARARRISDILGWIDWCDTSQVWPEWQSRTFDDTKWALATPVDPGVGTILPAKTRPVQLVARTCKPMAQGRFATSYGYELDDPPARFFLEDLAPREVPAQGVWRRYDLGRVRLGRPKFTLDVPKGAIVEIAMSEQLTQGRVRPWITLSGSASCNLDHYIARGGVQEFMPFTPKGGRFVEVHVRSEGPVKFVREGFLERTYFSEPIGAFKSGDPLLDRIWSTGVETMRACTEDAFVDCPTRERGQWTGDVASVAMDIAAAAYGDLSLSRRALVQAAQAARSDGLVAGVGPGDPGYLSTYAAQWVTACLHYWKLTGDRSLLTELLPAARRNVGAILAKTRAAGVSDDLGWAFVDWGYVRNSGATDMALNIHVLRALRDMVRWEFEAGSAEEVQRFSQSAQALNRMIELWLEDRLGASRDWSKVGYHRSSLALLAGIVKRSERGNCVAFIKRHLMRCFPNDPSGPRLSDPSVSSDRVMTPYFAHFAFTALLELGEIDFVLNQYRTSWGWALGDGRTTWLEVFDPRWSHCHEWSGCPTWQLSRYVLGLRPRLDLNPNTYELSIHPGALAQVSGRVPLPSGKSIEVGWTVKSDGIHVRIRTPEPLVVLAPTGAIKISGSRELLLPRPKRIP